MLSHLRFHRRGGGAATAASNPTSPCPDITPTSPPTLQPSHHPLDAGFSAPDARPASSSSSALPPTLPPITRVTSAETEPALEARRDGDMVSRPDPRSQQQLPRSPYNGDSGFIGGVALRKYQRDVAAQAPESRENLGGLGIDNGFSNSRPSLIPIQEPAPTRPQALKNSKATTSFSTPTEFKNATSGPTGRRPAGTRLASEPPLLAQTASNPEPPKAKKGLPFLKNPMSTLLMRRKNSQHVPDLLPLPLGKRNEEPMYDPRIKGTRVHDFSAPRTKKALYVPPTNHSLPPLDRNLPPRNLPTTNLNASVPDLQHRQRSNASESLYSTSSQPLQPSRSTTSDNTKPVEAIPPPSRDAPPVPPKDDGHVPAHPVPAQVSRLIDEVDTTLSGSGSMRSGRSRQASLSSASILDGPSAVPRHMKSTSSRFSFDMIGAAKQEKLLEDRHRQREAEKKTADSPVQRDSRFDDFDEDFDYDAMMDDDGFEEPIPMLDEGYDENDIYEEEIPTIGGDDIYEEEIPTVGDDDIYEEEIPTVGLDAEQDLDDPDNDQENFSGFVFERSNPTSSLTSPHSTGFLPTPRDADGKVIGFAFSKDTPGLLSPQIHTTGLDAEIQSAGLGIQGLDISTSLMKQNGAAFQQNQDLPPTDMSRRPKEDDIYYDDGMLGFENEFAEDLAAPPEWDPAPFDESIFDNNDTDQYGRPIPGAFAQAQTQRRAHVEEALKRESDITSRLSVRSALSQSTADTSLSVDHKGSHSDDQADLPQELVQAEAPQTSKLPTPSEDTVAAYQAALAAAAHKAAASGKFQRGSSPPIDDSPTLGEDAINETVTEDDNFQRDGFDDYGYEDMADFEMDEDDYVAEANASALANDSDGWYGQEFGFYSAPAPAPAHLSRDSSSSSLTDFEYSNGGFFGPKGGLDRSVSGRMVSREPNLTPITERSEYSNRNSIMSMGLPGFSSGTPLQSPGLAQLALLGDRGDDMTLSALLRLRSKAWGGSQLSLASSREGSPRSERGDQSSSPWGPNYFSPMAPPTNHARKNSVLSTFTADSEGGSISGSPTLTNMGFHGYKQAQQPPLPGQDQSPDEPKLPATDLQPQLQDLETKLSPVSDTINSPLSATVSPLELNKSPDSMLPPAIPPRQRPPMGHRHKNSADSISYTKEEDSGATRWVMERRRTGEYGQVEILEREVVEGGRI